MFSFTKEQNIVDISGIKLGGQPGNYPTTLIGGFFFKGKPDFNMAKEHLKKMYECSKKTGNPAIPDFFVIARSNYRKESFTPVVNMVSFIFKVI